MKEYYLKEMKFIFSMLTNLEIKIKSLEGVISEIKILEKPKFGKVMKLKTLSPILVRKPIEENTKLKGKELYPTDKEFTERLISNLMKKFYYFYGIDEAEKRNQKLSIKFLRFKPKRHRIINTYHRCVLGEFIVEGNKDLIEFGYDCGFGEKNSMGFGMVKKI
jgi:CRISPR-associated endoribonuclease Cas6